VREVLVQLPVTGSVVVAFARNHVHNKPFAVISHMRVKAGM